MFGFANKLSTQHRIHTFQNIYDLIGLKINREITGNLGTQKCEAFLDAFIDIVLTMLIAFCNITQGFTSKVLIAPNNTFYDSRQLIMWDIQAGLVRLKRCF